MKKGITAITLLLSVLLTGCSPVDHTPSETILDGDQNPESVLDVERYTLNEDSTVLTMACWCLTEKEAILVDAFNRTHADYQIEIMSYFDGDPDNYETALLQMQTKLLTGDEPDLYSLNSMDVVSMEKAGLLMDLKPLMEADETFHREDYFMNVWDQYAVEGSLYEFVPTFVIRGLVGPKSLVGGKTGWTYAEMVTFIAEANKQHKQATNAISIQYMIQGPCAAYLDVEKATCLFDSGSFGEWMEMTKQLTTAEDNGIPLLESVNLLSINNYLIHKAYYQETPVYMGLPSADGAGPYAAAIDSFAISSSTQHPDVCWEFLCGLMEESLIGEFMGVPMKKSLLEQQLARAMLDPADPEFLYQSDSGNVLAMTEQEADEFLNMVASIAQVKLRYDGVTDIITEEMELWLNGSQTKEQTVDYLQNRVGIYLSEQQ